MSELSAKNVQFIGSKRSQGMKVVYSCTHKSYPTVVSEVQLSLPSQRAASQA